MPTGTGTGFDIKTTTDTKYTPNVKPIVKEMVSVYLETEIATSWKMVEYTHQCIEKQGKAPNRENIKKAVKEEMVLKVGKEEAAKKLNYINRAILVAFWNSKEEVAAKREAGISFNDLYLESRSPQTKTVAKQQAVGKDGDKPAPAPAKKTEQQGVNLLPGDDKIPVDDLVDKIDAWIDNSKTRAIILMEILVEKTWIDKALQEIYRKKEKRS